MTAPGLMTSVARLGFGMCFGVGFGSYSNTAGTALHSGALKTDFLAQQ